MIKILGKFNLCWKIRGRSLGRLRKNSSMISIWRGNLGFSFRISWLRWRMSLVGKKLLFLNCNSKSITFFIITKIFLLKTKDLTLSYQGLNQFMGVKSISYNHNYQHKFKTSNRCKVNTTVSLRNSRKKVNNM